jgi:RNA:NAD 2'-phosphotransferase (TPT1/KptA family)
MSDEIGNDFAVDSKRKGAKGSHSSKRDRRGRDSDGKPVRDVVLSKALSYVLRHGAEKEGIALDKQGYAIVSDLVRP